MVEDVVRNMGLLCFGSRLKRIGERLQADLQRHLDEKELAVQSSHYPLLVAVDCHGALTITDLVQALGISQPGITRTVNRLVEQGLLNIARASEDQRKKTVSLSSKGQQLVDLSRREIWPVIEAGVADLCGDQSETLLTQLAELEDRLNTRSLDKRMADLFKESGR